MIIEAINKSGRDSLKLRLESLTRSMSKRGIAFVISVESEFVASITILVTGKLGTVQKTIVLIYNETYGEWQAFSEGVICKMYDLSEIVALLKSKINKLNSLLLKI